MKKYKIRIFVSLIALFLSSCATYAPINQPTPKAHQASHQKLCTHLRHEIVFQTSPTPMPNLTLNAPTQQAMDINSYEHYSCADYDQSSS